MLTRSPWNFAESVLMGIIYFHVFVCLSHSCVQGRSCVDFNSERVATMAEGEFARPPSVEELPDPADAKIEAEDGSFPSFGDFDDAEPEIEADEELMCPVCNVNIKAKKQFSCYSCLSDVKAAEADAKAEGKTALLHFKKCKKEGGSPFKLLMLKYRSKCGSVGRGHKRPAFGFVDYFIDIVNRSKVSSGRLKEWLPRRKWIIENQLDQDIDEVAAARNWEVAWEKAGKGERSKCGKYLLTITKRYVDAATERMREERTRMGTGSVKNPSSDKIKERLG